MRPVWRGVVFWLLVLAAAVALYRWLFPPVLPAMLINQARLLEDAQAGNIASVTLPREAVIEGEYAPAPGTSGPGRRFQMAAPQYQEIVDELDRRGVAISVAPAGGFLGPLRRIPWLGAVLMVIAWLVRRRNARLLREAAARA